MFGCMHTRVYVYCYRLPMVEQVFTLSSPFLFDHDTLFPSRRRTSSTVSIVVFFGSDVAPGKSKKRETWASPHVDTYRKQVEGTAVKTTPFFSVKRRV